MRITPRRAVTMSVDTPWRGLTRATSGPSVTRQYQTRENPNIRVPGSDTITEVGT